MTKIAVKNNINSGNEEIEWMKIVIDSEKMWTDAEYKKVLEDKLVHLATGTDDQKQQAKELWENPPTGLKVINLAFDLIPKNFISGYITEYGIIKPKDIKEIILKKYPWLLS